MARTLMSQVAPGVRGGGRYPTSPFAGLAAVVGDLVAAGMYDPETDPRVQQAKYYDAKTSSEMDARLRAGAADDRAGDVRGLLSTITDPEQLRTLAPRLAAGGYGTPTNERGAGDAALLIAGLMGGDTKLQDDAAVGNGLSPDQTRAARRESDNLVASTSRANNADNNAGAMARLRTTPVAGRDPVTGAPVYTTQGDINSPGNSVVPNVSYTDARGQILENAAPTLTPEQTNAVIGAEPRSRTPYNYSSPSGAQGITYDGVTDATTNEPLEKGTQTISRSSQNEAPAGLNTSARSKVTEQLKTSADLSNLISRGREVATSRPEIFGTVGNVLRGGKAVFGQLQNAGLFTGMFPEGGDLSSAYTEPYAESLNNPDFDATRVFGEYDPNLDEISKISMLLAYKAAGVLVGQEGRSLSDADVKNMRNFVGDPTDWFATQEKFLAGLDLMDYVLTMDAKSRQQLLDGVNPLTGAPLDGSASRAPTGQATSQPAPAGAAVQTATNPETGEKVQLIDGQWVPVR